MRKHAQSGDRLALGERPGFARAQRVRLLRQRTALALYYAAGANINRVNIEANGASGAFAVHYYGAELSFIDDFAIMDGRMAIARALPPALIALDRTEASGTAPELGTRDMDLSMAPSSISYQSNVPAGRAVFPVDSLILTSFFGGGIYSLTIDR